MKKYMAIGLMSGTSIDGIDVALIKTDGFNYVEPLSFDFSPYDDGFRNKLRSCFGKKTLDDNIIKTEKILTKKHGQAVLEFLNKNKIKSKEIDLIGFHGQTIWHNPKDKETIQIGDGKKLSEITKITVVNDFRSADVKAGGQGAPLVPVYHKAICNDLKKPIAIINIGGVSNVTYIDKDDILAFDMGVGNALLDDWILSKTNNAYDDGGKIAKKGKVDNDFINQFMSHSFFKKAPPKSLDRDAFSDFIPNHLSTEDGAATLTMMIVSSIAFGIKQLPVIPNNIYITGGGRHNKYIMESISKETNTKIFPIEKLGCNGDALEAQAFAYLSVRSLLKLPITFPTTTSVPKEMTGGKSS